MDGADKGSLISRGSAPSTSVTAERKGYGVVDIGVSEPIPQEERDYKDSGQVEPRQFWVLYGAEGMPQDGLAYRPVVDGEGPMADPETGVANRALARLERQVGEIAKVILNGGHPRTVSSSARIGVRGGTGVLEGPAATEQPTTSDARDSTSGSIFPVLIGVTEAAALLGISRTALYSRIERGQVKGVVRSGRRIQFHRELLLARLAKGAR